MLPLGSYDILIGMDWLESHKVLLICYNKSFVYQDGNGVKRKIQGLRKPVSIRQLLAMKFKKCIRKGCQLYVVQIMDIHNEEDKPKLEDYVVLRNFKDVLLMKSQIYFQEGR
jgi:hypothetical protein